MKVAFNTAEGGKTIFYRVKVMSGLCTGKNQNFLIYKEGFLCI
jgi:hypothetical protein